MQQNISIKIVRLEISKILGKCFPKLISYSKVICSSFYHKHLVLNYCEKFRIEVFTKMKFKLTFIYLSLKNLLFSKISNLGRTLNCTARSFCKAMDLRNLPPLYAKKCNDKTTKGIWLGGTLQFFISVQEEGCCLFCIFCLEITGLWLRVVASVPAGDSEILIVFCYIISVFLNSKEFRRHLFDRDPTLTGFLRVADEDILNKTESTNQWVNCDRRPLRIGNDILQLWNVVFQTNI